MTYRDPDPRAGPGGLEADGAEPDRDDQLLAACGRQAWLEAVRQASRVARHDLANVLTGISFYSSELLAELPDGTDGARNAAAIGEEVARGAHLLERLLLLWREPSEAEVVPLDAAAVVDALVPLLAVVAAPADVQVGPLDSIVVRASRRRLEEAILVLVLDARAAGGRVRVAVEAVTAGEADGQTANRCVAVRVAHEPAAGEELGWGRAMVGVAGQSEFGPGLGLALAHAAARAGGGTVEHEPEAAGAGATTLLLPEARSRRQRVPSEEDSASGG